MKNTDNNWEKWGVQDPYFAVLTDPKYKASGDPEHKEFFNSGEEHIDNVIDIINCYFEKTQADNALDFGCGVGRLVIPLSKRFKNVVGMDISNGMLEEAKKNCGKFGLKNISFLKSDDELTQLDNSYDLVHTHIVLQHIPYVRGKKIIGRLLDATKPGGIAVIHISLRQHRTFLQKVIYFLKHRVYGLYILFNIVKRNPIFQPLMQMNSYNFMDVLTIFKDQGFGNMLIVPLENASNSSVSIVAQKPRDTDKTLSL